MLKTTPNFAIFMPLPVKIRGRMSEISIPIVEALSTTEPSEYIRWSSICAAHAEHGGLIKKKKKKVHG